ncbi:hypothetical protein, partial [Bacillus subtilis]
MSKNKKAENSVKIYATLVINDNLALVLPKLKENDDLVKN